MPSKKDLYQILGVKRDASGADIKKAYRKLARKYHPDVNPGDQSAEARFKDISEAHDILSDKEKRPLYDRYGHAAFQAGFDAGRAGGGFSGGAGGGARGAGDPFAGFNFDFGGGNPTGGQRRRAGFRPPPSGDVGNLFSEIFGAEGYGAAPGPERGEDVTYALEVGFREAVLGTTTQIQLQRQKECETCGGSGRVGKGAACGTCRGAGLLVTSERIRVRIPEGVADGAKVRVAGKGGAGRQGGHPGDLIVVTRVAPHPYFKRTGDDISTEVPVTVPEAVLGAEVEVPTVHGPAHVRIPAGTQGGQRFRLKGKGVKNVKTKLPGDHYYTVTLVLPKTGDERERQAAELLAPLYADDPRAKLPTL